MQEENIEERTDNINLSVQKEAWRAGGECEGDSNPIHAVSCRQGGMTGRESSAGTGKNDIRAELGGMQYEENDGNVLGLV